MPLKQLNHLATILLGQTVVAVTSHSPLLLPDVKPDCDDDNGTVVVTSKNLNECMNNKPSASGDGALPKVSFAKPDQVSSFSVFPLLKIQL